MYVSQLTSGQLVVFFSSSIPVVFFDNPGISNVLNTLFLLTPYLSFIIGLSVVYLVYL